MASRAPLLSVLPAALALVVVAGKAAAQLQPPTAPPENPITEQKRALGKVLFWDEQLSTSNTVSCGTCHSHARGGSEPRPAAVDPGGAGAADDTFGSPGVSLSDVNNDYIQSAVGAFDSDGISVAAFTTDEGDYDLRALTRVAVAVAGDITGDIEAGSIVRVQALGLTQPNGSVIGGSISGNIRSYFATFGTSGAEFNGVGTVAAGNTISGDIEVFNEMTNFPQGGIDRVVIGPALTAGGLQGSVIAHSGTIGSIYTHRGAVARTEASPDVLNVDFNAVIVAGEAVGAPGSCAGFCPCRPEESKNFGAIHLIRTDGDLNGSVSATNIAPQIAMGRCWPFGLCERTYTEEHAGILIGGVISAPISIGLNLDHADIIAASINAPVTVGLKAQGAIVATDTVNGQIVSVDIGNVDPQPQTYRRRCSTRSCSRFRADS